VGVALLFGAWWWDARLQARQDALATAIANRQDDLARDLANQAEVLENTRFLRQIATSRGNTPKPFAYINLVGAELGGLHLRCTDVRRHLGCGDFTKADLREANLTSADLGGADFMEADLYKANVDSADFDGANLADVNLGGVATRTSTNFRRAILVHTSLVQAELETADFRNALLSYVKADEAVLPGADFRRANLEWARLRRADLRHAIIHNAKLSHADLMSADLRGADFTGTDLSKAFLGDVCFDHTTKWGSNAPPASSTC
jgi:uncharacterized protein YjbI with pentapeptide repeats